MKWIALYINCIHGDFRPYGPFETEEESEAYCQAQSEPELWSVFLVETPE